MRYVVVIEGPPDGSYWACVPDLPGCVSAGDTPEQARRNLEEAVALHLESLRQHDEPVPPPSATAAEVEAA